MKSSLTGPCMIPYRSLTEDLVEILARSCLKGPCKDQILQMPCIRGACMKAFVGGSWEALGRFLCQDLVMSSPAAVGSSFDDLVRFS